MVRWGWYLLLYAGIVGILGIACNALGIHLWAILAPSSGSLSLYRVTGLLSALIPLLAAPIGALIIRRSEWLSLCIWIYLGFAIPMAVGIGYLLWHASSEFPLFGTDIFASFPS